MKQLLFTLLENSVHVPTSARSEAFLLTDNWDDWFEFSTLYVLIVVDEQGQQQNMGGVKIGQFGMKEDQRRPELPRQFHMLGDNFFSLGQDDSYYESIGLLGAELRDQILSALRDVAADPELWERASNERVMKVSLLRSVSPSTVEAQFRRMTKGGARLTSYAFSYRTPVQTNTKIPTIVLSFDVQPDSSPPTNIHVLIGRNGVGKTYVLDLMTRALVDQGATSKQVGIFSSEDSVETSTLFASLVSVTFSAFDPFEPLPEQKIRSESIKYSYVGLKRSGDSKRAIGTPKSPDMLANEFVGSLQKCLQGVRRSRWKRALHMLAADPIFKEADATSIVEIDDGDERKRQAHTLFSRLSSGHKIVLLTITRLVETVEERTLVLLDEPEAHLHPPLLAAFIRSLSDLLTDRNGVAIVATHSPVVLQEVPRNCVWKLRRTGRESSAERPEVETFGENVGVLTREAFGLEVTQSGFHKMLRDAIDQFPDYQTVLERFGNELGAEAKAIVRALEAAVRKENQE